MPETSVSGYSRVAEWIGKDLQNLFTVVRIHPRRQEYLEAPASSKQH